MEPEDLAMFVFFFMKITILNFILQPHVLNYPDPKMLILQKHCEDMFALTTAASLGEITSIELWFDCSGPSTSW